MHAMNDLTTTTKSQITRDVDGVYSATVTIKLTKDQWLDFERKFGVRAMACHIGLDNPRVSDFVMFQIFGQLEGKQ